MRRAFKLGQSNEVVASGHVYDLHNDYVPTAIVFDAQRNDLRIAFKRLLDDGVGKSATLVFHEVDLLELRGNIGAGGISGVDELGYKDVDDYDYEWLSREGQSSASDPYGYSIR
jgi:hypothetical protein